MDERQYQMLKDRVTSKVHWGEPEEDILYWLSSKYGISGSEASGMLKEAYKEKRKDVRKRALINLVLSGIGVVFCGFYFFLQIAGEFLILGWVTLAIGTIGVVSLMVFLISIFQLITGYKSGAVMDE